MKSFISKVLFIAFTAVLLISCLPDRDVLFTDTGMCTRLGRDRLQTDNGNIYNIVENDSGSMIADTLKRVMISCDVLSAVSGKSNEYDIRIIDFRGALCEEPVVASSIPLDTLGVDGVNVVQAWVSGGYLNSFLNVTLKRNSETVHDINLLFDDFKSNADTLYFKMRHNAHGESPENPEESLNNLVFAGVYASFPLNNILPIGGKYPIVHLEWDWYLDESIAGSREKSTRSGNLKVE